MSKRVSNICFTLNNPEGPLVFEPDWMQFLVYQKEVGESGTPHFQGYLELTKAMRFSSLKKKWPTAHFEERAGTQIQAIVYATKEDTRVDGPWQFGEKKAQGHRSDIEALVTAARIGVAKKQAVVSMPATYVKYFKAYSHIQMLFRPDPNPTPVTVTAIIGRPGTGKTRFVKDNYPDHWQTPLQKEMWFDGYDGQKIVLLDDFVGQMPLSLLLQLLDRYIVQVPVKGGFVWWNPEKIFVTSNYPPDKWYDFETKHGKVSLDALIRRFTEIKYME